MRLQKKRVAVFLIAAVSCLLVGGKSHAATGSDTAVPGTSQRGQVLALSCAGCHGTDGKSSSIMPSVYGKTAGYIESALRDFKLGTRTSTVMGRHAKGYTDEEIHLIAEYFGSLSKQKN